MTLLMMLLVFIGQTASAAVDPCQNKANSNNMSSHVMSHERDTMCPTEENINPSCMSEMTASGSASESLDCCEQDCTCPVGDLVSAILIPLHSGGLDIMPPKKFSLSSFLTVRKIPVSLYHPPIFA